jgi:hypothetical protein
MKNTYSLHKVTDVVQILRVMLAYSDDLICKDVKECVDDNLDTERCCM